MIDKKTQLAWLDKQRSIVNDMIVNLPPDEQRKLLPELQVINAIAERVRDMTALEYLEARTKMCYKAEHCKHCAFTAQRHGYADLYCFPCTAEEQRDCSIAVELVKRWKEEQDA